MEPMSPRRAGPGLAVLLAFVVLAAACASDDDTAQPTEPTGAAPSSTMAPTTRPGTTTTVAPEGAAACGTGTAALPAGESSGSLMHDGVERTYERSVPASYDGTTPAPVLLNFHGFGGTGAAQNAASGLVAPAGERGYVVVAPDGGPLTVVAGVEGADQAAAQGFDGIPFWNIFGSGDVSFGADTGIGAEATQVGYDDIGFVTALLDELEATLCVDTDRIYAAGHSNGAGMSSALGCEIGSRLAAIGPVAGVNLTGACPGDGPVPVLSLHGDADEAASYEGNNLLGFELGNPSVPDRMAQWATLNGCDPTPTTDEDRPGVVRTVWSGCDADTELWTITEGSHAWPGGDPVDANVVLLDFFDAHIR